MATATQLWTTNSPEISKVLRAADRRFDKAIKAASMLALAEKIIAIRAAKDARQLTYSSIVQGA